MTRPNVVREPTLSRSLTPPAPPLKVFLAAEGRWLSLDPLGGAVSTGVGGSGDGAPKLLCDAPAEILRLRCQRKRGAAHHAYVVAFGGEAPVDVGRRSQPPTTSCPNTP